MGGIGDYSGCLVAEMPIAPAALVGAQRDNGDSVRVRSANAAAESLTPEVALPVEAFVNPVSLHKRLLDGPAQNAGPGTPPGVSPCLRAEGLRNSPERLRTAVRPLDGATRRGRVVQRRRRGRLHARALRGVRYHAGRADARAAVPACRERGHGRSVRHYGSGDERAGRRRPSARPAVSALSGAGHGRTAFRLVGLRIDSAVKHAVGGSAYTKVRVAAFMGYKMLAGPGGQWLRRLPVQCFAGRVPGPDARRPARDDERGRISGRARRHLRHGDDSQPGGDVSRSRRD